MPGLAGCVSRESLDAGVLRAMTKPMLHRPDYRVHEHIDEYFVSAAINLASDRQSGFIQSPDGRCAVVFFGSLYESWAGSKGEILKNLLSRWRERGWRGLADLNGEYLVMVWNYLEKSLTIVNDRLGLEKLCYWTDGAAFAWASEVKGLAVMPEVSRAIDEHALSELLTFGHLQDDRTLLRDVKLMPPGSCLTWKDGQYAIHQYWDYVYQADPVLANHECAVREYYTCVREAVHKRLKGLSQAGLFLSGGLDSRTLAGMIRSVRPDIELWTWTAGHGHDHDSRFARRIARTVGSRHEQVSVPETFLQDYGADYAWVLDGMVSTHGSHRSCLIERAAKKVPSVWLGYMGDTASGGKPLDYFHHISDIDELARKSFNVYAVGFDEALLEKLLKRDAYQRVRGLAYGSYEAAVRNAKVEFAGDRVVYAELVQRQRLFNPPAQMDLQGAACLWVTPFTDREFIDFSLRLPWQERLHKKAYLGMLCQYFPKLAGVPRSGDGLSLTHSRLRASLHWRWVLFNRHTLPKLTGGMLGGHNYGAFVHCAEWFRKSSADFIRSKLISSPILEEHFKMDELNRMIESFLNNTAGRDLMDCIASLMSYVLFRERLDVLRIYQPPSRFLTPAARDQREVLSL